MNIIITTFAFTLNIANLLQVIALFIQWKMAKTYHGPGWWTLGTALIALGFLCIDLRAVPELTLFSAFSNNVLVVCGQTLLYIGILRFIDRRERRSAILVFLIVYTLMAVYSTLIIDAIVMRRALFYVAIAALSFVTAYALLRYKMRIITTSAQFLSAAFLIYGGVCIVSIWFTILNPPSTGVTDATPQQVITMVIGFTMLILCTSGVILMVNQRLNAESREAKDNLELIFNTNPDAVSITRVNDGDFVRVNDGFTPLTGYSRADVLGKSTLDIIWKNPVDRQTMITALNETGVCDNLEAVFRHKNGQERIGSVSAKFLTLDGVTHILSVMRDITERKAVEQ
jgi:PAS domain S-box-containing protein